MVFCVLGGAPGQYRNAKQGLGGIAVLRELSGCVVIVNTGRTEDTDVKAVKVKVARRSSPTGWSCEAAEGATVA
jgi:hypothetical protein